MSEQAAPAQTTSSKLKLAFVFVVVIAVIVAGRYFETQEHLQNILKWIKVQGPLAPLFFGIVYALCCVLFIPGSILTIGAGTLFGVVVGSICVSAASVIGATCCFLIGRYFARDWVAQKIEAYPKFKAIDEAVARDGWKIVGLTRLSPIFPFNLLNYSYGITKVSLRDYVLASWVGMFPGTVMYVYIGSVAKNFIDMGERARTPAEWAFYLVGLIATVVVTVYVTRISGKALAEKVKGV